MTVTDPSQSTAFYDSIKLGIDAHAQDYGASRQVNGESVITRNAHPLPEDRLRAVCLSCAAFGS